jgi:hypothetical protein
MSNLQSDYADFAEAFIPGSESDNPDMVPVQVHIIRRSNGTGGITEAEFNTGLSEVNDFFINANMEFFHCSPINFINSDTYFNFSTSEETGFWNTYGVNDVLNIIIPGGNLTTSSGGGLCGYAYLPGGGRDLITVARSCFTSGGNTFAHEIGHYFGLYHTHGKTNCGGLTDELVNGSNCNVAGDDVCDTPADPGLLGLGCTGYLVSNCVYTGSFTDANGDAFVPDVSNVMSYAPHSCRNTFSAGQYARASFYNINLRNDLSCGGAPVVGATCTAAQPVTNNGNYFPDGPNEGNGCGNCSGGAQHSDWFYYDATSDGSISISSCLSNVNTRLWVYTGSCGNLIPLANSDDDCIISPGGANLASEVTLSVNAGNRYYFEWDDRWSSDNFSFSFSYSSSCNPPANIETASASYSHISQNWEDVPGAQSYNVRYRLTSDAAWTLEENITLSQHTIENLSPCNTLEWQVQSNCNGSSSAWSAVEEISTTGCSDAYCYSYGNSWSAWITNVALSNLSNSSGNGNGYTNFTNMSANVVQGQSYTILLNSDDEFVDPVYWRIWADLNQDNDFEDPGELLFSAVTNSGSLQSGAITIPSGGATGTTRMRVSMDRNTFPEPCATGGLTDVEDYSLNIQPGFCNTPTAPLIDGANYSSARVSWAPSTGANAYQVRYRTVGSFTWLVTPWTSNTERYLYNLIPCSDYQVEIRSDCGSNLSDFSATATFSTVGCDEAYCYSYGNSGDTWIDRVNIGAINNISGNDHGYGNYTHLSTSVQPGNNYALFLQAQGTSSGTPVYWRVWIDLNQDDDFDDAGEQLYQGTSDSQGSLSGSLFIPEGTAPGSTRMRVSMSTGSYSSPCSTGDFREVEDYQVTVNNPDFLTITPGSLSILHTGGTSGLSIESNTNWQILENAAWLTASPQSGIGNGIITLNAIPNPSTDHRSVNIVVMGDGVSDQIVTVTQTGAPANIAITPASQIVTAPAGQTTVQVTSNTNWTLTSNQSWATLSQMSGTGDATVTISYNENTTSTQRLATLTLNSPGQPVQTATILQNAAATGPTLTVSPSSQQVSAPAGQTTVSVNSNVNWTASASQSWATLSATSGFGNQSLIVSYTENTTGAPRSVTVNVSTTGLPAQIATITQAAGAAPTLAVTPSSITAEHLADCVNFSIASTTSWTANSPTAWVTSVTPSSGSGNGTITVCYEENNSGSLRMADILISGGGTSVTASINQNPESNVVPWPVTPTGITHTVVVPDTLYSGLEGTPLSPTDWIGFFYDDNGTPRCAGAGQWDPNNNTAITVYGDDAQTPEKDGFDEGEFFQIQVLQSLTQDTLNAQGAFAPIDNIISHTNRFALDGLSKLDSIFIPTSGAPWTVTVTGDNHSVIVPNDLFSSIDGQPLSTDDYIGFFYTDTDTMRCAGFGQWNPQSNTVITVYGDDAQTPEKDGFAPGETFTVMIWRTSESLAYEAVATYAPTNILITHTDSYATDGISALESLTVTLDVSLDITLDVGWNTISSYVIPDDLAVDQIFSPVATDVIIVKDGVGNSYIPTFNINDIGNWDMLQGYQVKMGNTRVLSLTGEQMDPQTEIPLSAGWQIVAYLRDSPSSVAGELASIGSNLLIAKNGTGDTYIPTLNIDDIGNMLPGRGYHLRLTATDTLTYSPNALAGPNLSALYAAPGETPEAAIGMRAAAGLKPTGNSATLIMPAPVANHWLSPGDEIVVTNAEGQVFGRGLYEGAHFAITVWGDDESTPHQQEALKTGQPYYIQLWRGGQKSTVLYRPVFETGEAVRYMKDAVLVISGLEKAELVNAAPRVAPNPVQGLLTIGHYVNEAGPIEYRLFSLDGRLLLSSRQTATDGGWQQYQMDLKQLKAGYYLLQVTDTESTFSQQIIKQ